MSHPSQEHQDPPGEGWRSESIQPKQKAVLEFLKMPVPPTRGGASNLIKAVFEGPGGNAHQNLWDASKHELHPDLYPAPARKPLPPAKPTSFFTKVMLVLLGVAVIFYAMDRYDEHVRNAVNKPAPDAPASLPTPQAEIRVSTQASAPAGKPAVSPVVTLESTDGRTLQARILALTKDTVLIRREDGQTFDLPLDRLTPESKRRIDEYRAAKRAGQVR